MLLSSRLSAGQAGSYRRLCASLFLALAFGTAFGQLAYHDLHDFGGGVDGSHSQAGVAFDNSGNAFGTTQDGGAYGEGIAWEITEAGVYKDIHDFGGTVTNADGTTGPDGSNPYTGVSLDSQGNVYSTTFLGGANESNIAGGMVWEITAAGVYKDLHDFAGTITNADGSTDKDGEFPNAGVSLDSSGNVYGATSVGENGSAGMVWEVTTAGTYLDLHEFGGTVKNADGVNGPDGAGPLGNLGIDSSGDIFGTTSGGGGYGDGMVWEINFSGGYQDLHDFGGTTTNADGFSGSDGAVPYAGVTLDSTGDIFGVTTAGGAYNASQDGCGMVWEITSGGAYKDLHDFGGTVTHADGSSGLDGTDPQGNVGIDSSGNFFGTTFGGGEFADNGMVWEVTSSGAYKDLHDFGGTVTNADGVTGPDGYGPWDYGNIGIDAGGNIYGTASGGGATAYGMIWELRQTEGPAKLSFNPSTIGGLGTTTGTITLTNPAPTGGWPVTIHAGASGYLDMPSTVTVPAGASRATFTITGTGQRPSTVNMGIFVSDSKSTKEAILTIQGDSLKSLSLSPSQIKWTSGTATGQVTIGSAAPPGGWKVTLTPGASGYVNMPTSVTIPAGSTTTTFSITGNAQRYFTLDLGITASDGGSKTTSTLVIGGDAVKSLNLNPTTIGWGGTTTATVNLVAAAPPGGWVVNTNPGAKGYVTMPTSITVPAGSTSATFTITAGSQRSLSLNVGIYANDGPSNQSAMLTIKGDSVKSLSLNPSSITALGTTTATVTLASAAPPGGWVLTLHPGASGYVSMPTTLTVPAGATTATFTITGITQHSSTINLGIFASDGNSSQEAILTIT